VPEHPLSAPPRTTRRPWTFLGGIALFIGLIFVGLAVQEWRYEAGSEVVQGIVLDKAATYRTGRGSSSSWSVMYRFTTRQGQTLEGKDEVFPNRWRALEAGGPVEIEYPPPRPGDEPHPRGNRQCGHLRCHWRVPFTGRRGAPRQRPSQNIPSATILIKALFDKSPFSPTLEACV
jgi:hypothetical protein